MSDSSPITPPPESLHGFVADETNPAALRCAVDLAFDYRGDVTIIRRSTPEPLLGYVFDRRESSDDDVVLRVIAAASGERLVIPLSDIRSIIFTGRDPASGKSFENWIRRYAEIKLAGKPGAASIEGQPLSEDD